MFLSLFLTCVVALGISTLLLITLGHRVRLRLSLGALVLALGIIVASGEIAARAWSLSSRYVAVAQVILLAVTLIAIAVLRGWNIIGKVFYGALLSAVGTYLAFAAWYTVAGGLSALGAAASALLFILELGALVLSCWYAFDSCDAICRKRWRRPEPRFDESYQPMVSLQIAAYNEPADMLIETIKSVEAMDYPNFELVVIDNNTKDPSVWQPVADYCRDRPKVRFEHVDDLAGFKAGALNLVMSRFTNPDAEILGVIDADYILDPGYLRSVVGYFADPNLAFVQTPQAYRDWEGDPYLTACADAYEYFFSTSMPSRNDRNSIIFAGTMGLIRRKVIEGLGGWEEDCITEDAEASLRILKAGHSGLYIHKAFGKGVMPLTFAALKSQRFRWALGGLQILRKHWRELMPSTKPDNKLTAVQKFDYLFGSLHWFNDLIYLAFTLVLLASAALLITTGHIAIRPMLGAVTLLPAALIGSGLLRAMWALRVQNKIGAARAIRAFANWLSLSWTGALACLHGIFSKKAVFLRTPKSEDAPTVFAAINSARSETFLAILLWGAAGLLAAKGKATTLLLGLLAWQGVVYGTSLYMSLLNQRTVLSEPLERRRRSEYLRERMAQRWPYYAGAAASLAAAAVAVALLVAGGNNPGRPANPFTVPHAAPGDKGPLTSLIQGNNVFEAPVVSPSSTPEPVVSSSEPVVSSSPSPVETISSSPTTSEFSPSPTPTTSP
jgi:cellulose synthase/poly-beta-1,6-N-acetylglucosamine synthase-like glycosyltransferase